MKREPWRSIERGPDALACIVCDKALDNWSNGPNQPCDGLAFMTDGHYPSSLFDAMGNGHLEISVCEECLLKKASKQVAFVPPSPRAIINRTMTVGTVRAMIAEHDDDVTFKEMTFRNGSMSSMGLPLNLDGWDLSGISEANEEYLNNLENSHKGDS